MHGACQLLYHFDINCNTTARTRFLNYLFKTDHTKLAEQGFHFGSLYVK